MNRKRIILLLTLCVAFTLAAQGQRFDWVRTYTGQDVSSGYVTNKIVGSCVDREGNYYFLGQFSPRATLCGVPLLPDSVIRTPLRSAAVIAKLSPQGNLLWHKAIYGTLCGAYPCALWQLGDTALMVMAYTNRSYDSGPDSRNSLYYLDTLLTGNNNYPIPWDSLYNGNVNAFITFRNDGSVIEQHFLCRGLLDTAGHLLTPRFIGRAPMTDVMYDEILSDESFCVDSVGNIYVLRTANDFCTRATEFNIESGNIGALKIVVDGVRSIYCPTQRTSFYNQQILKFSPHFASLLASTYVFDSTWLQPRAQFGYGYQTGHLNLNMDSHGNLYLNLICDNIEFPLRVSGSDTLFMDTIGICPSVMIKYNSNLHPIAQAQLSFTGSGLLPFSGGRPAVDAYLSYPHIDEEFHSVFLTGLTQWTPAPYVTATCTFFYDGDTLDLASRGAFWLRLDMDDLRPLSMGKVRPYSRFVAHGGYSSNLHLATQNNRVFGQTEFSMGIVFGDSTIMPLRQEYDDQAFLVWGYDGTELFGTSFHHCGETNMIHGPRVVDSIVYLAGSFLGDATFDTIAVPTRGATYAYIAQYVDTSFMTPYVMQDTRKTQRINWSQELAFSLSDSLVPLRATSTSGRPVTYTCSDTTVARVEGTTLRLLAEGDATVTASQEGTWQYQPATPVTKPLHVGRAGIESSGSQMFVVYPNPAHTVVNFHTTHKPVRSVRVVSSQGREMMVPVTGSQMDISALPAGVYYIQFVTENNVYNHKIIKM